MAGLGQRLRVSPSPNDHLFRLGGCCRCGLLHRSVLPLGKPFLGQSTAQLPEFSCHALLVLLQSRDLARALLQLAHLLPRLVALLLNCKVVIPAKCLLACIVFLAVVAAFRACQCLPFLGTVANVSATSLCVALSARSCVMGEPHGSNNICRTLAPP